MNINPLMENIREIMNIPVEQDLYTGRESRFIVYNYTDERAAYYGDDDEEEILVTIQVQLITPKDYDYFSDKATLKQALKDQGFVIEYMQTWLDDVAAGTDMARRTIYTCHYAGADN